MYLNRRMLAGVWRCGCAWLLLALGACALPPHPPLAVTTATDQWAQTPLGEITAAALPNDDRSGFRLLPVASYAFATRLALADRATRTLDVQYYIFADDDTGRALFKHLAAAARRGVRVRVLIDDLYSTGEDRLLQSFAAIPNVEVRLFNPFAGGRGNTWTRLLGAGLELSRIDRRMHNKLFIADNAAALAGGRNIANEYFMQAAGSNFVDLDLFAAGPAVRQLSLAFDRYWNSANVFPLASLMAADDSKALRAQRFDLLVADAKGPATEGLPEAFRAYASLPGELDSGHLSDLMLGEASVVADDPDKAVLLEQKGTPTVTQAVLARLAKASHSVIIVSPYFVPGEAGMQMMHAAHLAHGTTRVFTNSLASTDEPLAEHAYMRYRQGMLEDHVELYELSPTLARDRNQLGAFGTTRGSLHAKCVLIDERTVFLGSMNLDHRSAAENTEVGIFIESPRMAEQLIGLLDRGSFYQLSLDAQHQVQWQPEEHGQTVLFHDDPETTWWQRVKPMLLGPLVPDDEL